MSVIGSDGSEGAARGGRSAFGSVEASTRLERCLGISIHDLLAVHPFDTWRFARSVDDDVLPKRINFEFDGYGVDVVCDEDERVCVIFLRSDAESTFGIPFSLTQDEVRRRFGTPLKTGGPSRIPGLGEKGAWDLFTLGTERLHVHYRLERNDVEMITLMRADWA